MISKRHNLEVSRGDEDAASNAAPEGRGSFSQHVNTTIVIGPHWVTPLCSEEGSVTQDWSHYLGHTRNQSGFISSIFLDRPNCPNYTL